MKKLVVTCLFGLFLFALAVPVQAQKLDFKASGFIDAISEWNRNQLNANFGSGGDLTASQLAAFNKTQAFMETRARLKFDAVMEKNLSGTIYFEMDSGRWGDTDGTRNAMGFWTGDRAAVEVKNVYIDVGLPYFGIPVPMTMRLGLQPLGIRPNLLVYTDGMGITGGINLDPVMIAPLWFKALEGRDASSDDVDVYGVHAKANLGTLTIGGYGLYYNMNTFPLNRVTQDFSVVQSFNADMWWFGAYADGKLGPVNINLDFIYDTGDVEGPAGVHDVDYKGWMANAKVDFPWEAFNFGVWGMYATGQDFKRANKSGSLPGQLNAYGTGLPVKDVKMYVVPPGSESGAIFDGSLVFYASDLDRGSTGIANRISGNQLDGGPTGGTWMGQIYASFKATPWYKVTVKGMYIGDTSKRGNTFGTARKASGFLRDDSDIGWEFDIYNSFQIYKNLNYTIAGGILFDGDALDIFDANLGRNKDPKTPWVIMSKLIYNF